MGSARGRRQLRRARRLRHRVHWLVCRHPACRLRLPRPACARVTHAHIARACPVHYLWPMERPPMALGMRRPNTDLHSHSCIERGFRSRFNLDGALWSENALSTSRVAGHVDNAALPSHIHRRRLLVKNYSKTKAFFHEIKKRPTRGGSLFQVQRSRISAQPHRCNGKSFQCPPNVIILLIIYFCGSALRLSLYLQLCSEFRITQIEIAHASQSEYMCSFYLSVFISTKNLTEKIAYSVRFSRLDVQSLKYSGNTSACRSLFAENLTFPRTYEARECTMVFCCAKGKPQYPTISRADLNAP